METTEKLEYNKIGGFLLLPIAGLVYSIFTTTRVVMTELYSYFINGTYAALTSINSQYYHPRWAYIIITELLMNIIVIIFCIVLLTLCFKKKSTFPKMMIVYFLLRIVFSFMFMMFAYAIPTISSTYQNQCLVNWMVSMFGGAAWITYFSISKRVKCTFKK